MNKIDQCIADLHPHRMDNHVSHHTTNSTECNNNLDIYKEINEPDPNLAAVNIPFVFICKDKTEISAYFTCDGKADCPTFDDEEHCDLLNYIILPSGVCRILSVKLQGF